MRKAIQFSSVFLLIFLISTTLAVPALAITESEVEAQVSASSREAVTGNVLIWFLCAIAFLKISQKIDSFMAGLGLNTGRTGGSLLSEVMMAVRAVTMSGGRIIGGPGRSSAGAASGASGSGFYQGGLIGMASRHFTRDAVKAATTETAAVRNSSSSSSAVSSSAAFSSEHRDTGNAAFTSEQRSQQSLQDAPIMPNTDSRPMDTGDLVGPGIASATGESTINLPVTDTDRAAAPVEADRSSGSFMEPAVPISGAEISTESTGFAGEVPATATMPGTVLDASPEISVPSSGLSEEVSLPESGVEMPADIAIPSAGLPDGSYAPGSGAEMPSEIAIPSSDLSEGAPILDPTPDVPQGIAIAAIDAPVAPVAPGAEFEIPAGITSPAVSSNPTESASPDARLEPSPQASVLTAAGMAGTTVLAEGRRAGGTIPVSSTEIPAGTSSTAERTHSTTETAPAPSVPGGPSGITMGTGPGPALEMPSVSGDSAAEVAVTGTVPAAQATAGETTGAMPVSSTGPFVQAGSNFSPVDVKGSDVSVSNTNNSQSFVQANNQRNASISNEHYHGGSIGGAVFASSLLSGGRFANDVIGMVAKGDLRTAGSITGDLAAQSMMSYMGHAALGNQVPISERVSYSNVEIGGGRITGTEVSASHPDGIAFSMYHTGQYMEPAGPYQRVFSADGEQWYKQYATDTVQKTPYKAPDGEVAYHSQIVKRIPAPPRRKDRI